jgi:pimeloyl-ACP methyl ester carboxylesterase
MDSATFEKFRRDYFAENGFAAEGRWYDHADGRRTYALVRGGEGVPAVVIHGGLAEASVWSLSARHLGGPVYIPDRPGFGLSSPIDYRGVPFREDAVAWLDGFLDAAGLDRVDLVGNSMGGFFCLAYAAARPERVRRIVLPGAPAGLDGPLPPMIKLWGMPILGPVLSWLFSRSEDPEVLRKNVFPGLVAAPEQLPRRLLEVGQQAVKLPGVGTTSWTICNRVSTLSGMRSELRLDDDVKKLPHPTLFLWGDRDQFSPPAVGRSIADAMPHARFEVLEGVGHMPQIEVPDRVGLAARDFLAAA